jgi:tetraacyldisaccharide 4'-kinase
VLYNADQATTDLPGHVLERRLGPLLPLKAWWANDETAAIRPDSLSQTPLLAAAGIGHPNRFFALLQNSGLTFERLALPDHANLDPRPWPPSTPCVIVTEKDAVNLRPDAPDADRIIVATLDLALPVAVLDGLRQMLPNSPQLP